MMERIQEMPNACREHKGQTVNFFCDDCQSVICVRCKVGPHSSHTVVTISKKCEINKRRLIRFQNVFPKKHEIREWHDSNLENSANKAKEKIHQHYSNVKTLFFKAYQKQIAAIEQEKCDIEQRWNNDIEELMANYSHSSAFIEQSNELLNRFKTGFYSTLTYVAPEEQYMRLTVCILILSEKLFGHCAFENKKIGLRRVSRCQSLVELPTSIKIPPKPPSELFSQTSVSSSMNSIPLSLRASNTDISSMKSDSRESHPCVWEDDLKDNLPIDSIEDKISSDELSSDDVQEQKLAEPEQTSAHISPYSLRELRKWEPNIPIEKRKPASLLNIVQGFLLRNVQIVEWLNGEPCVVQANNCKLHVPKGVNGAILVKVHTNHAQFMHHVPRNDCLVSPVCEFHLQKPYRELILGKKIKIEILQPIAEDIKYQIKIRHIVKNVDKVRSHIRIRHGNLHSVTPALEVEKHASKLRKGRTLFDIDEEYVTIHTNHFSGYMVTAKGINCCAQRADVYVFGSLTNNPENSPLAAVKIFLSNKLTNYQSYLQEKEEKCKNPFFLLQNTEIHLSTEKYDASESEIQLTLTLSDGQVWTFKTGGTVMKPLNEALQYNKGHICRINPTEVTVFYLESSNPIENHLRVKLNIEITIREIQRRLICCRLPTRALFRRSHNQHERLAEPEKKSEKLIVLDIYDNDQNSRQHARCIKDDNSGASYGKLGDMKLWNFSGKLSSKEFLRNLAIHGLGLENCELQKHLEDNLNNIRAAAYSLLIEWRATQVDERVAFTNLCAALDRSGMPLLKNELE